MVRLPAPVFASRAGAQLLRFIKSLSKLRRRFIKVSSIARIGNPMDDEALDSTASAIKLESSGSKASGKARLIAMAEDDGLFFANRSAWAARWQHPLAKSIQGRRGKVSRL